MKRALRYLLSFALPIFFLFVANSHANAQCPVVIDSIVTADVTCNGALDGSICVYVSGGFPNYNFVLANGPVFITSGPQPTGFFCFTGLGSETTIYEVIAFGEDGGTGSCLSVSGFATINVPPAFTVSVTTTNDSCPDGNVGTAVVDVTGGVAPYTYSWLPFIETSDSISGLDGGNYSVTVTDTNGCPTTANYTIVSPPDWDGTLTGSNPTCFGGTDGSVTSTGITGGTPPYTFSWTGTAQTTENIVGLSDGAYTLTVTDDEGCTQVFPTIILTEPTQLVITETHVNVSCDGLGDGSIDAAVSGGVSPYSYLWTNGATTQGITGLSSGNYILTVTDGVGCSDNISVTILDGSSLSLSSISISSECNEANGSIDLTVTGGSSNYGYAWQPGGQATEDLTGLAAGIYDVTVTDNTIGCIDSLTVIVNDFPGHDVTGVITDGSNCISNDGSIDASVTGGSGDFSYSWSHGPLTEDVSGLAAGTYFLTVTDNIQGCVSIASFNVQTGNEVDVVASITEPSCGLINGGINLTVSGGTNPYTFLWSSGAVTEDISGVGPGVYSVTITDVNGCPFDTTFTLSNQGSPLVTETVVEPNCPDSNDGSVSVVVSAGTGPYTFNWSTGATTPSITGLAASTYNLTVTDQGTGCVSNESYTLTSPPGFNGFIDITHVTCGGTDDGAIDITLFGGTPPYSFLWTPGNFPTEDISGLAAGTYTGNVTDDSGCTISNAFTVTAPPTLVITETHIDVSCNGDNDGSIDISISGGTPGFTYLWQPGGSTGQDTTGLSPGIYEVFVTDAGGCADSLEIEITEPTILTLTSSSTDATCNTSCDGTATVTPSGGTLAYTYVWTPNVSAGPTATALCAGTYDVVVSDANGCSETASFTISDIVVELALTTTNISCNGSCDGAGSTVVTGTNPPFTYDWQPSGGNGPTVSNLCAGAYTLTVMDATGCSVTESFTIMDPDPIVITMAVTDVSCEGLSDGEIDLTVTGGVGPYTYQWFPLGQTTEDINGLPAGDYSIVVTDANGCTSSAITLGASFSGGTLFLPDGNGDSYTTAINVTGFPSNATLTSASDFQNVCLNMEHSYLGDLDIQLTCPNGTTVDLVQSIGVGIPGSTFLGDADDGLIGSVPGVGWTYCWTPTPTFGTMETEAVAGNTVAVTDGVALPAGDYTSVQSLGNFVGCPINGDWTITVTDNFNVDNGFIFDWGVAFNGSGSNDSLATVNEPGPITSTSNVTDANCGSCDGEITITPAGGNAPYTFLWNTGATSATISSLCAGVYNVIITDANGCEGFFFIPVDHIDGPTGANTTIVDASCFGTCDGEATVTGIGGAQPYTYQWVPGGFATSSVTGLCAGTYNVQIQDSLNCIYTETVVIDEPAEIFIGQTVINSLCGQCTGEVELSPISGQAPFTYDWSPAVPNMDTLATDLCAGVYNVTVTDATGCEVMVTSLVNDIPSPTLTMTGTDPLCNSICDGETVVTPAGGTPPFTFLWDDAAAQTDSIATGLCAGLYTATLTDANGCVAVNQITLSEPDPIGLSLLIIDNGTCAGNCDGSITVIPSGGTIPFTYLWDDPLVQTTATASSLCAGVYNVVVTDANGCSDNNSGSVSNPVGLTATTNGTDASCNGVCDGSAFATITGGTAPFTYLWDDAAGQTSDTAIALCAGSYTVTITDVNGCDFIAPVTIDEPDPIVITFSNVIGLLCDGDCIGEATADVTGGTAPYTYSWDDALTQFTTTADSLCASNYTVTITDANGCTETASVTISGPNGFSSNIASQNGTSCNGNCDGGAVAEGIGGTPPYTFQWNDPAFTANDTVTGLCAGIYSVTVTDDNSCISVSTVVIDQPDTLIATTTGGDVSCFGECDGEATTFTLGGTFPYFYQWNDPANQTTLTAVGLCPGSYQVVITDANGCVADTSADIFEPTEIVIDTTIVEATCGICNGEITVTPNGGVQPYTYSWGNGETTAAISSLCPGVYTVDVTDAIGCTVNFDIPVSNTGGPTSATVAVTDASCFGICDGEATVTPIGGIAPYAYLWVPGGQTTPTVTGLCAGSFNVQIVDSAGCIYTQVVTVGEPAEIVSNANTTQATCGQCDGEIVLAPTGGNGGPYTYSWAPAVSVNETATGLCAGIYTVTITDGIGCETIETIPISNIDGPILTAVSTDATCDGDCDGTGTVTITGGAPPYTTLWDDPLAQTDPTATGLCAGTYNVIVTDDIGCQSIAQITIDEPDPISLSLQLVVDATCAGSCDGSATVVASGGTLPFTYDWAPSGGTSNIATGLCADIYTVTVTDANGCAELVTITINEPPAIIITTNSLDANCNGLCDGEAYAEAAGSFGGFTYQWDDLASTTNDTVTGLCAGTYQVVVTDIAGCMDSTTVTINEPDSISIAITVEGVSCAGDCDGTAIALATGGNLPYTYQWNDPGSTLNDTVTDLCPGIYGLVVTDSLGCAQTATVVIDEPLPLALTDSAVNITCGGSCDGIAGVLVTGGTPTYTYQWDDPNNSTTPFITGLCAGTYQVVVIDANGCADSTTVTIIEPPVLEVTIAVQNPSCGAECDGEATVTITGGTPVYGILWLPGLETTPIISNLCAGLYTVIVIDAAGCSDTAVINLTEPPILEADITSVTQVLCSTGCTGAATVTGTGGTPPFTYQWNDPASQTSQTAIDLCIGIWSVTITDDIGCTATATTVITDSAALVASIPIFTPVTCNGECDGTATVFANGGVGPYTYSWDDTFNQTTQTATGLCAGTYTVTVTDSQNPGCVSEVMVIIIEPIELTASASATDVVCGTDCDGTALTLPVGGTPPYQFSWNDPASTTTIEAIDLCVGTYTVTITDANGCSAQASATVNGPLAIVSNAATTASSCSNLPDGSIDLTVVGGMPGYDFNWTPGNIGTEDLTNVEFGTYTVTITDQDGCSNTAMYSVGTLVDIDSEAGFDDTVCIGTSVQLIASGGGDYLWSPAGTLTDATIADPVATPFDTTTYLLTVTIGNCVDLDSLTIYTYGVPPVDAGDDVQIPTGGSIGLNANGVVTDWTYSWEPAEFLDNPAVTNPVAIPDETTMFYVTVTDENGCTATDSILVEVTPGIEFPDGITPNGDGINDTWRIDNIDLFDDAIVEVYNRWGQALFISAAGYPVPWDGRYKGKDLPVGTYYYVIHSANFEEPFTGPITIVR